jgi:hypothetical protein
MSVLTRAPRRQHSSLVRLTQIKARLIEPRPLEGDQIFGDEGQILTAPPEKEEAPDTRTTPAPEGANDRALADEIAALDDAHFLALNIEADEIERDHQRAEIARMQAEQLDAYQCGQSCDYSAEIEAARAKIAEINERLFSHDLARELAS